MKRCHVWRCIRRCGARRCYPLHALCNRVDPTRNADGPTHCKRGAHFTAETHAISMQEVIIIGKPHVLLLAEQRTNILLTECRHSKLDCLIEMLLGALPWLATEKTSQMFPFSLRCRCTKRILAIVNLNAGMVKTSDLHMLPARKFNARTPNCPKWYTCNRTKLH